MRFHEDPLLREEVIAKYLLRRLDAKIAEEFESHYLACEDCFAELRATHLLILGLGQPYVERQVIHGVAVLQFTGPVQLTRRSPELAELSGKVFEQKDTRVLIDLSRVSRIDSAGLGLLMSCYSHALRNRGALKLLNPSAEVQKLLQLTKIDSLVETYRDEGEALRSFRVVE